MAIQFIVNQLDHQLQLLDGNVKLLPNGGWARITDAQAEHEDVVYALNRNWATLTTKEPKSQGSFESGIVFSEPEAESGTSDLKSLLKGNPEIGMPEVVSTPAVKSRKGKAAAAAAVTETVVSETEEKAE